MKGIVLAGGAGTRLHPLTKAVSKQLLPVYDKPMIYYPISTLMSMGVQDILVITTPRDEGAFMSLLGGGNQWGVSFTYAVQPKPEGIAQALIIGERFVGDDDVALILGDNIFHAGDLATHEHHSTIYVHQVADNSQYGVLNASQHPIQIEEKPDGVPSWWKAVVGLYVYRNGDWAHARKLKPSARGELEITDLNNHLLRNRQTKIETLGECGAWFDAGSPDSLLEAGEYVRGAQRRTGVPIGSPEHAARENGWIK